MEDFFTKSQSWKKVRQTRNQEAAHAQKRVTVPLRGMSGAECNKTMVRRQAVVFSASSPSRLSGDPHSLCACLLSPAKTRKKITPVVQATDWMKTGPKRRIFLLKKIGHQKRVKGAMQSYLLVHFKKLICSSFHIKSVPKTMVQFCYVRLYLGTETVSCRGLSLLMARINMNWRLRKMGYLFQVLCITQKDIFG